MNNASLPTKIMSAPPLDALFFTVGEVFVRLGQNRLQGCLVVYNRHEAIHVFVEDGQIVAAHGGTKRGELALSHALHLDDSSYGWLHGAEPETRNVQMNIYEYAVRHSIARDVQIGRKSKAKIETVMLPKDAAEEREVFNPTFRYTLSSKEQSDFSCQLIKRINVIGRGSNCDLVVEDSRVSRQHCLMEITSRGILVKDLQSTNGTSVNGAAISEKYIDDGDVVNLGGYTLILNKEKPRSPKMAYLKI